MRLHQARVRVSLKAMLLDVELLHVDYFTLSCFTLKYSVLNNLAVRCYPPHVSCSFLYSIHAASQKLVFHTELMHIQLRNRAADELAERWSISLSLVNDFLCMCLYSYQRVSSYSSIMHCDDLPCLFNFLIVQNCLGRPTLRCSVSLGRAHCILNDA